MEYIIDASGKVFGRLASEIAVLLRGKNLRGWQPHKAPRIIVRIKNIDKIVLTGKKTEQKVYIHHTRYAGGLRTKTYKDLIKKDPGRPLKLAVMGMLPKNRQRAKIIKNLIIEK